MAIEQKSRGFSSCSFLPILQKVNILINRCLAEITHPCELADIELSALIRRVMPQKGCGNIIAGQVRSADLLALGFCICHSGAHPCAYHSKLQLTEHACHLQKCFCHWVCVSVAAIHCDTADNDKAQPLLTDCVYNLTQLFGRTGKARNLQRDNRIACLRLFQKQGQLFLDCRVPVFVFQIYSFRTCLFQFAHLPLYILPALVGGACSRGKCAKKFLHINNSRIGADGGLLRSGW